MSRSSVAGSVVFVVALGAVIGGGCRAPTEADGPAPPAESAPTRAGWTALQPAFSDDETMIALALGVGGPPLDAPNKFLLLVMQLDAPQEAPHSLGSCAGPWVAFDDTLQAVFSIEREGDAARVTLRDLAGTTLAESPAFGLAEASPPPAMSRDSAAGIIAVLYEAPAGRQLLLWWPDEDRHEEFPLPGDFEPNMTMPPFISGEAGTVVLVSQDREEFAGLSLATATWRYASVETGVRHWQWREWASPAERRGAWKLGDGGPHHYLFVDCQARHLWATQAVMLDATYGLPASASLERLDIAHTDTAGDLAVSRPVVYADEILQVSGDADGRRVALIYRSDIEDRAHCGLFAERGDEGGYTEHVVYGESEVPANCGIAVSPSGRLLAVPHTAYEGEFRLSVFRLPDVEEVAVWTLLK